MKITIEPTEQEAIRSNYPSISISIPDDDLLIAEAIDSVIKPALIAWGYSQEQVNTYFEP